MSRFSINNLNRKYKNLWDSW